MIATRDRERARAPALFITYDGLLDPLGQSQILPYLYDIASHPRELHIISFEKPYRFNEGAGALRKELDAKGVMWTPLSFTSRAGKTGKVWDLVRMYATALRLQWQYRFGIVHCRSYQAMQVGCFLRRLTGTKTIFDMRGLWVDDRVDRGIWPQDRWPYRLLYRFYKRVERRLVEGADTVVVLTASVIPEIHAIAPNMRAPITVIPCCADFDHFEGISEERKRVIRSAFGINPNALVLSYLGSLGAVYALDDMLRLFAEAAYEKNDVHLLLITKDWTDAEEEKLVEMGIGDLRDRIHIRPANRDEVPQLLSASDAMLNFIKPTFSMKACSPTKMAESLAVGVPVIGNVGVGDVEEIIRDIDAGMIIDLDDPNRFELLVDKLGVIRSKGGSRLRNAARERLGLENAKSAYGTVYESVDGKR